MTPEAVPSPAAPEPRGPLAKAGEPYALPRQAIEPVLYPVRIADIVALVLLVGLGDFGLYSSPGGIGAGVLFVAAPLVLAAVPRVFRASPRLLVFGVTLLLLAARSVWQSSALSYLLGLGAVFGFAVALRSRRLYVPELVASATASSLASIGQLHQWIVSLLRRSGRQGVRSFRWGTVLIPIVVVVLFALVFTAANPVLERWLGMAWDAIFSASLFDPWRIAFWVAAAFGATAALAPRLCELRMSERLGPGHLIEGTIESPTDSARSTARNLLIGVNLLFLAYNALDAVYLWAGTPPPGLDHTGYAHRGTAWLTVSLAMSTVVLGLIFRGSMNARDASTRLVRILGLAWAAQNFVLAAGTFRRISMYVDDSGLTELRCLGIAGVALVAVGFGLIVLKVARRHTALWLLRRQLDAFLLSLVLWTVTPVDTIVWSFNVARIQAGEDRPLLHLYEQHVSPEGLPVITRLLRHPDRTIARGVAERLAVRHVELAGSTRRHKGWRQAELSSRRALAALRASEPRIQRLLAEVDGPAGALSALRERAYAANGLDPHGYYGWRF